MYDFGKENNLTNSIWQNAVCEKANESKVSQSM